MPGDWRTRTRGLPRSYPLLFTVWKWPYFVLLIFLFFFKHGILYSPGWPWTWCVVDTDLELWSSYLHLGYSHFPDHLCVFSTFCLCCMYIYTYIVFSRQDFLCPGTQSVNQDGLKLTEICLPLVLECWGQRCAAPLPSLFLFVTVCICCWEGLCVYGLVLSDPGGIRSLGANRQLCTLMM